MLLFMVYKAARRDFQSWIPGSGFFISALHRVVSKLLVDFTSCVHFRQPFELGGIYYLFTTITSLCSSLMTAALYCRYFPGEGKPDVILIFSILGALFAIWVVAFCCFLLLVKRSHVRTFWCSRAANGDYAPSFAFEFQDSEIQQQLTIFQYHEGLWKHRAGDHVTQLLLTHYARLQQEQPPWLEAVARTIPDSYLPKVVPPEQAGEHEA
jgi:hypothetical protein